MLVAYTKRSRSRHRRSPSLACYLTTCSSTPCKRALTVGVLALLGCAKPAAKPVPPMPAPAIAAAAPPAPSASITPAKTADPRWRSDPPATWTDPRVIDGLAADCDFLPPERVLGPTDMGRPADLFRCMTVYEQSCVIDVCMMPGEKCKERCGDGCRSCGDACSSSCKECKSGCTDETCKRACASSCADCKQTCNRTMDRCASGACSKAYDACGKAVRAAFVAHGCGSACVRYQKCMTACNDARGDNCWETCQAKVDAKFEPCRQACGDDPDCVLKCHLTSCSSVLCEIH